MRAFMGNRGTAPEREGGASAEEELLARLDPQKMPRHVAIIMDGNRRWARQRGLGVLFGHRAGARATRAVIETSVELEIPMLTLYTFSTENWRRPKSEVNALMHLIEQNLRRELAELHENNVQIRHLGHAEDLPAFLQRQLARSIQQTRNNTGLVLNLALNYGGRREIVDAARKIAEQVRRGALSPEQIDETLFSKHLYTGDSPDPDLLIRTGGDMRTSNFLPWQIAYAELHVTPVLWPDFSKVDFLRAAADFQTRERRFGATASGDNEKPG